MTKTEIAFLSEQFKNHPNHSRKGRNCFLENSNISTGGDSIDFTDDIIDDYKAIAVAAAQAVGARICGADIIIEDIHEKTGCNELRHHRVEL